MTDEIVRVKFGSHLYGTDTPESDTDFKAVFLPSLQDCVLNRIPRTKKDNTKSSKDSRKNTKDDVDFECYSLQYFLLELGRKGDTSFLDMIHAPDDMIVHKTPAWDFIRENRSKFYTKNLKAYIGYCRTQASKYGVRGSRLESAENVINFLSHNILINWHDNLRIKDVWDELPEGEHITKNVADTNSRNGERAYVVCGRKLMENSKLTYSLGVIEKFYNSYGERAKLAKENKGIDWKAISHALRAGYQLKEIYETGDLKFPLKDADFLRSVKQGELHYIDDGVASKLEELIDEVEVLAEASDYPKEVDIKFCEEFIEDCYND